MNMASMFIHSWRRWGMIREICSATIITSINYIGKLYNPAGRNWTLEEKDCRNSVRVTSKAWWQIPVLKLTFLHAAYPYTVDYEEEDDIDGILDFADWFFHECTKLVLQFSKYVSSNTKISVRYRRINVLFSVLFAECRTSLVAFMETVRKSGSSISFLFILRYKDSACKMFTLYWYVVSGLLSTRTDVCISFCLQRV